MSAKSLAILAVLAPIAAVAAIAAAPPAGGTVNPDALAPAVTRTYCGHHIWAISTFPAAGFNPLTATTAELNRNGFPPRPTSGRPDYRQWTRFAATHRAMRTSCAGLRLRLRHRPLPQHASKSANWAGYVVNQNTYTDAEADWDLPRAGGTSGTSDYSAAWVGIGLKGSATYPIYQAGSESDYLNGSQQYYLWYEAVPGPNVLVSTHISPGDLVGAHVTVDGANGCGSSTCAYFHLWDDTNGVNQEYVYGNDGINDGHAEWIYERPCFTSGSPPHCWLPYLADAPPAFTTVQAVPAGGVWTAIGIFLAQGSGWEVTMWTCNFVTQLAYPRAISANELNFAETFVGKGDNKKCYD